MSCAECPLIQPLATAKGISPDVIRLSFPPARTVCPKCGHVWDLHENAEACEASD